MKIKVCGMRDEENLRELARLPVDAVGFIFYEKSPRFAGALDPEALAALPAHVLRVGVFVNAALGEMLHCAKRYQFNVLQLHGEESPAVCERLRKEGFLIWKALPVLSAEDVRRSADYAATCDRFLFDAKSPQYGGVGKHFPWELLVHYDGPTPFFLSGGIAPEDLSLLRQFSHPRFEGIDLNSRFEIAPGLKDISKIQEFLQQLL